jgi:ATP-dependent RNA helicase RhlE
VTLPGFDYTRRAPERFEVPIRERIAAIRARKADERARAKANAERRAKAAPQPQRAHEPSSAPPPGSRRRRTRRFRPAR